MFSLFYSSSLGAKVAEMLVIDEQDKRKRFWKVQHEIYVWLVVVTGFIIFHYDQNPDSRAPYIPISCMVYGMIVSVLRTLYFHVKCIRILKTYPAAYQMAIKKSNRRLLVHCLVQLCASAPTVGFDLFSEVYRIGGWTDNHMMFVACCVNIPLGLLGYVNQLIYKHKEKNGEDGNVEDTRLESSDSQNPLLLKAAML